MARASRSCAACAPRSGRAPIPGLEHVPAGAGFAALGLGFLGDDEVRIFETGPWTRLTTQRGHVLVKRKAWTLAR